MNTWKLQNLIIFLDYCIWITLYNLIKETKKINQDHNHTEVGTTATLFKDVDHLFIEPGITIQ